MPEISEHTTQPKRGRGRPRIHPLTPAESATREQSEATRLTRNRERALDRKAIHAIKQRDLADSRKTPLDVLLVTVKQAAEALQISEKSVWVLAKAGHLTPIKILGSTRFGTDELKQLSQAGTIHLAA